MNPKTPILQDKRLFLAIASVIALLASNVLGIHLDTEVVAAVVATVLGYITNSAFKEASVAKTIAASGVAVPAPVAPAQPPVTPAEAAAIIAKTE